MNAADEFERSKLETMSDRDVLKKRSVGVPSKTWNFTESLQSLATPTQHQRLSSFFLSPQRTRHVQQCSFSILNQIPFVVFRSLPIVSKMPREIVLRRLAQLKRHLPFS